MFVSLEKRKMKERDVQYLTSVLERKEGILGQLVHFFFNNGLVIYVTCQMYWA